MRLAFLTTAAALLLTALSGCAAGLVAPHGCHRCGAAGVARGNPDRIPRLGRVDRTIHPGPPAAAYAYPYYTVRGPRDFLLDQPAPLGR